MRHRLLVLLLVGACLPVGAALRQATAPAAPRSSARDTIVIDSATRAAGFTFAGDVAPGDRSWILAAIASARPEARALIDRVDGLVEVRTVTVMPSRAVGETAFDGLGRFVVTLDVTPLDGRRVQDRDVVVLHELGHVVDRALVPEALNRRLDAGIPPSGGCESPFDPAGPCSAMAERFADTWAKWALRGATSVVGAGYGVPMPPSVEGWGAPLTALAYGAGAP